MRARGSVWIRPEIELIVKDYLDMLQIELAGGSFNKLERNKQIQRQIGRSKGSIEYKHQNISAVMEAFELPFVWGYKPASSFQELLSDVVLRHLTDSALFEKLAGTVRDPAVPTAGLSFSPAPRLTKHDVPKSTSRQYSQSLDPAARDARARELGEAGERFVFRAERNRLCAAQRWDLSTKVRWISKEVGDGEGYDILSFSEHDEERWLEVKTTNGPASTPFWISANELRVSRAHPDVYRIVRLYSFSQQPTAYKLIPPLCDHLGLSATQYRATLR